MPSGALPGYNTTVEVSSDGGANYNAIGELREFKFKHGMKMMDATSHDSAGDEESIPGNRNWTGTADALRVFANAGQVAVQGALTGKTKLRFRVRPNGVGSGKPQRVMDGYIEDFEESSPNSDLIAINLTIKGTGAVDYTAQP